MESSLLTVPSCLRTRGEISSVAIDCGGSFGRNHGRIRLGNPRFGLFPSVDRYGFLRRRFWTD